MSLSDLIKGLVSSRRWETLTKVARNRTRHVVVVLENVLDRGNENAVLRSADAFGFQDVHVIRNDEQSASKSEAKRRKESVRISRTDAGARKWLTVHEWDSTKACLGDLTSRGYCIAVASPLAPCSVTNLPLDPESKTAIVFGNEHSGLSDEGLAAADLSFSLPMYGFVESLNVSVAAAITMYELRRRISDSVSRVHHSRVSTSRVHLLLHISLDLHVGLAH